MSGSAEANTGSAEAGQRLTRPRLTRQSSNNFYRQDQNFLNKLLQFVRYPRQSWLFKKEKIIFYNHNNNLIIKPSFGETNRGNIEDIAKNQNIAHITIHKPNVQEDRRRGRRRRGNTKIHFVIGNVSKIQRNTGKKQVTYFPIDLSHICEGGITFYNQEMEQVLPSVMLDSLPQDLREYHDDYMKMFMKLPSILQKYYEPCIKANRKAKANANVRARANARAMAKAPTKNRSAFTPPTSPHQNQQQQQQQQQGTFDGNFGNWENLFNSVSGGGYKSYVHVPNFGKRLVRYRKNGKAYVILKGKKKNLYK